MKLSGDAVKSLTRAFLVMWDAIGGETEDAREFFPAAPHVYGGPDGSAAAPHANPTPAGTHPLAPDGFVQPYVDSPLDNERVGEEVYLDLLRNARRYCYFVTPYLVLSDELTRELIGAAKRGVDVRIITPGFPHAKMCVTDDCAATVGTINLDFRSLYLHFENGVLLLRNPVIADIRRDFDDMFRESHRVRISELKLNLFRRIIQTVLRLFAPLM